MLDRRSNKTKNGVAGGSTGENRRAVGNGSDGDGLALVPGVGSTIHENDKNVIE